MIGLIIKRTITKNILSEIKQGIYYFIILTIVLVLCSYHYVRYEGQQLFLQHMKYQSVDFDASEEEGQFLVGEVMGSHETTDIVRGVYSVQLFIPKQSEIDYQYTYFSEWAVKKEDISKLKPGEAIISEDVAAKLELKVGDRLVISHVASGLDMCRYTIKGIMRTKYAYEQIGQMGTVLAISEPEKTKELFDRDEIRYASFYRDGTGRVKKSDEERETWEGMFSNVESDVTRVVFLFLGVIFLCTVILKEIRRAIGKSQYQLTVLSHLGMDRKVYIKAVIVIQGIVLFISGIPAFLMYKNYYIEGLVREKVSYRMGIIIGFFLLIFATLISVMVYYRTIKSFEKE